VLAGAFERLVGEDPDRPDPDEGRGGAGERVAMALRLPTPAPHVPHATPCPRACAGTGPVTARSPDLTRDRRSYG